MIERTSKRMSEWPSTLCVVFISFQLIHEHVIPSLFIKKWNRDYMVWYGLEVTCFALHRSLLELLPTLSELFIPVTIETTVDRV